MKFMVQTQYLNINIRLHLGMCFINKKQRKEYLKGEDLYLSVEKN